MQNRVVLSTFQIWTYPRAFRGSQQVIGKVEGIWNKRQSSFRDSSAEGALSFKRLVNRVLTLAYWQSDKRPF
jgi:hypothetical protein